MEAASPARLYAAAGGALLLVLGVLGFFYDASFGSLDSYEEALGALQVNGWVNVFYIATGAIGLLVAGVASRGFSLLTGLLCLVLAAIGWGTVALLVVLGVLGLAAALGTSKSGRSSKRGPRVKRERPRKSKPRAKPAGKRA